MLRKTIVVLPAALLTVLSAAVAPAGATGAIGTDVVSDRGADGITAVGEAIYAPTVFEQAVTPKLAAATARTTCADQAYAFAPWKLGRTFDWHYNSKGVPASVAPTALTAMRNATWTLFHAGYTCGGVTNLGITDRYRGRSTRKAQVSSSATCTGNDNVSVVSWGRLPSNVLAYTCVYYRTSSKTVVSSDVLINNSAHQWFTTKPARCHNQFDLQSVMVHERGHTAGLNHVNQRAHASQTMSGKTPACSTARRTLGAGDVAGMKTKYRG